MAITVTCECGKQLRVKDESAGKKGRCPACGNIFKIPGASAPASTAPSRPAPSPSAAPKPRPKPKPVKRRDSIDLDGSRAAATPRPKPKPVKRSDSLDLGANQCPGCNGPMPSVAVVCVRCGYDTRSGKSISTRMSGSARTGKTKVQMSEADLVHAYRSWAWLAISLAIICAIAAFVAALRFDIITFENFSNRDVMRVINGVERRFTIQTPFFTQAWMMLKAALIPLGAAVVGAFVGQFLIRFLPK